MTEEERLIELLRAELELLKREIMTRIDLRITDALMKYSAVKHRLDPQELELFPNAAKPENPDANTLHCSFCGKDQHNVFQLFAGPGKVFICNECVDLCVTIVREKREGKTRRLEETP